VEDIVMDPTDVSWVGEDQEEVPQVKTVNFRQRSRGHFQELDSSELDGAMGAAFRKSAEQINASSKQWFAQEIRSRNAGTSRSVGGSAITGHTRAKSKTGALPSRKGSLMSNSRGGDSSITGNKSGVKAANSMLSVITDKSRHFA